MRFAYQTAKCIRKHNKLCSCYFTHLVEACTGVSSRRRRARIVSAPGVFPLLMDEVGLKDGAPMWGLFVAVVGQTTFTVVDETKQR